MLIEIRDKDLKTLAELAFIGERIINGVRAGKANLISRYSRVSKNIIHSYLSTLGREERAKVTADLNDLYFGDEADSFISFYDDCIWMNMFLDNWLRRKYPDESDQLSFRGMFEYELKARGLDIVEINIPDLEARLMQNRKVRELLAKEDEQSKAAAFAIAKRQRKKYYFV